MFKPVFLLACILAIMSSCTSYRKVLYFPDVKDSAQFKSTEAPEIVIRKADIISIHVSSPNPEATELFNLPNNSEAQSSTQTGEVMRTAGYLVASDGHIRFPMIGLLKAEGLTKKQLQEYIRTQLIERKLLLEPTVEIRHLNFKVTVLGEVTRPMVINVPNEKITLLEALGLAGDMTINGKRENVLVIRDEGGQKIAKRINLNSNELLQSTYYFLKPDDVVYVEPNKNRVAKESRLYQILPIVIGGLSTSIFILDRVIK